MDAHVRQRIQAQNDGGILLHQGCLLLGKRRIVVAHHLAVSSPAFRISAIIKKIADGVRLSARIVDCLVQMAGISFVGQGCKQRDVVGHVSLVDVDDVILGTVDGRHHVECRA